MHLTKRAWLYAKYFCTNGRKVAILNDNSSTNRKVNDCYSILTKLLFATNILKKYLSYFYGKRSCYFLMKCCSVNYTTQMHFPCRIVEYHLWVYKKYDFTLKCLSLKDIWIRRKWYFVTKIVLTYCEKELF